MITDDLSMTTTTAAALAGATDPDEAIHALEALAEAFRDAGAGLDALARTVIPDDLAGSVCDRYRSAADGWPAPKRPSYEQLAAILSALHDAAAGARLTARRCDGAVRAVSATA